MEESKESKQLVAMEVWDEDGEEKLENRPEVVRWEKFLPRMVLRVLLVEADDSTRRIITALLRKCNYKVVAISDGLKAWEIVKRRHSHIDLILTEMDLPSISGYALLTLITEHDGCRNIPVIIMSSQDSINMALKCLLKGAVDFLIKPVRKNELKNLWRHVWRRLSINVGQNPQKIATAQLEAERTFENDPERNNFSDNVSIIVKSSKSSEKAHTHDLLRLRCGKPTGYSHNDAACCATNVKLEETFSLAASDTGQKETEFTLLRVQPSDEADVSTEFKVGQDSSCPGNPADLIGRITKHKCPTTKSSFSAELNRLNNTQELELTLSSHDADAEEVIEKHILSHSRASAFSRYSGNKRLRTFFPSTMGDFKEMNSISYTSVFPNVFSSNVENKRNDFVSQSTDGEAMCLNHQVGAFPLAGVIFDGGVRTSYSPTFQPPYKPPPTVPTDTRSHYAFQREESPFLTSASLNSDPETHSYGLGCSTFGEITYQSSEVYELRFRECVDLSSSSTPRNDIGTQKSSTGHGSVSEVTDVNATAPTSMVATSALVESVQCDESNTLDDEKFRSRTFHHSAEREAALAKFRLKRKGRCFEKKVQYQSRKRLAEQRARVQGQFVRQSPADC